MKNNERSIQDFTQSNRKAWNQIMPAHQKANKAKLDDAFQDSSYSVIKSPELEEWNKLGFKGKDIAHLCCNNGIELMSLKNMGAGRCVGFDISDLAIEEAQARAILTNNGCEYVCSDVYEIPSDYNSCFDVVYITSGALGWISDIDVFFAKVKSILRPSGTIFIYEIHPFTEMLPTDGNTEVNPLQIIEPYFKNEPYEDTTGLDYLGKSDMETTTQYWFVWTISELMMAMIEQGYNVSRFIEYSHDISETHNRNQEAGIEIPMSFILIAKG
ncbi:class I SAM-dependent methyltransferase [Vibrio sp. LaRot3]|uniref:class I SAM-dependent methyltransferase n=1 Tax=Vibrio sp. LaRot3 TaxID=2998829 RepID=UPI0022CDE29D|nr:class I SAM-dependent methyltransferase [Vibrio sp. LaRot3]MDA0149790.1 class I SAM-dependent methyltransferase [Vibrio sp. LaRot3]